MDGISHGAVGVDYGAPPAHGDCRAGPARTINCLVFWTIGLDGHSAVTIFSDGRRVCGWYWLR